MRIGLGLGLRDHRPWSPRDIGGLALWLRGDDYSAGSWADLSGHGNNATQATGSKQPAAISASLNGHAIVRFDGTDDTLSSGSDASLAPVAFTHVVVCKTTKNTTEHGIAGRAYANGYQLTRFNADGNVYAYVDNAGGNSVAGAVAANAWVSLIHTFDGTTNANGMKLYKSGSLLAQGTSNTATYSPSQPYTLGMIPGSAGSEWGGDMAEVMLFSKVLSAAQRAQIDAYISRRFGI